MPTKDKYKKIVPIKYTSRDYESIRRDLMEHAKRYYPDTYQDFNEASFGSLMLDTVAYVGDIMSFYIDYQANESFLDTAIEYSNIVRLGKQLGYKLPDSPSSYGKATFYILIPASSTGAGPDTNYIPILRRGSKLKTSGGLPFTLNEDIDFSLSEYEVVVGAVDEDTGVPTSYAIKAYGEVVSGKFVEETFTIGAFERFRRLDLSNANISEITEVSDSEGNVYVEVDNLSQNTVYKEFVNRDTATKDLTQSLLKPVIIPRRFVTDRVGSVKSIVFGHGTDPKLESEPIPDPSNVVMKFHGKNYITDTSFDPTKLIETDKFGIAPANTVISVVYRTNSTAFANVPANRLNIVETPILDYPKPAYEQSTSVRTTIRSSLEITNESPIVGATDIPTTSELKIRIQDHLAAQNRAVTKQDYVSAVYNMPAKFGSIKRCNVIRDPDSLRRNINLYIISMNARGQLTASNSVIKKNLKIWLNSLKMINDTIDILDARIMNLGINFEIIAEPSTNKYDILRLATLKLANRYSEYFEIGRPIYKTDILNELNSVPGLLDVVSVDIVGKSGTRYADTVVDLEAYTSADGRYIDPPENTIFEIKFPEEDVKGAVQ